ncbi:MAG: RNA polymerase sigma factor [Acholeplasmatales bacterium]|nr:RNA polymerase sigma factor [Acholeplasmatales bacterium]
MIDEIIEEFRVLNYSHFDEFYNETKKTVFFAIAAIIKDDYVIDDLMQDTYVKFLENINKYQSKTNIKAFLSTIAHNLAINYYNKEKRVVRNDEIFDYIPSKSTSHSYENIKVLEILEGLDDLSKEIVVQHVINDLKFKDIAKIVDKPLGTVLWIYNKAIKELKRKVVQ